MASTLSEFAEILQAKDEETRQLREDLDRLEGMIDKGWRSVFGTYDEQEGPSLDQIKETAKRNRELMAMNPHIGNGLELINSYVWADGIHYDGIPGSRQGRGANVQAFIDDPINQENYFGRLARKQRQTAFYCDGIAMFVGEEIGGAKTIKPVSIMRITDDYRNPEDSGEIWAYRHTYTKRLPGVSQTEEHSEWIFVNRFLDKRGNRRTIDYNGKSEPIAVNKRMFTKKSNPVVGWAYGLSDVQRGISWAEDYRRAMLNGESMNASMASIWATMKQNSTTGANNAAVTAGNFGGSGGLAQVGQGNAMTAMTTAGQAYDFARLLPILANFAAGIGVSVIALSMNSGNAGGSYGAARSLDRPEQLSTKNRREYNSELDREVLIWLGADPRKIEVWFDPIIDLTEKYRGEQVAELRLGTGLYEGEEIKRFHAELDGKDPNKVTPVPEGWLIPNNKESIELRSIDPNTSGTVGGNPANGGDFAPTQGSGAATVDSGSGDQRSDDIRTNREVLLQSMQNEEFIDTMKELIHELAQARARM
jgi:hypothetical protein